MTTTRKPCFDPARSETLSMSGSDLHGSWEISSVPEAQESGGTGKAQSRNPVVHADEKSDTSVVPEKPSNKGDNPAEMVEGRGVAAQKGTPQGAVISPLLANIYLHYAQDQWAQQWRGRHARDKVMIVRYADDSVFGFKSGDDARRFLAAMQERLDKFGLTLNAKKTRLIDFGRFAASTRKRRGQKKPETFDFLGFTHCCSTNRQGLFQVRRLTVKKRMRLRIAEIRVELMRRRHQPVAIVGKWLNRVVQGYLNYHAVPGNLYRLGSMCKDIGRAW